MRKAMQAYGKARLVKNGGGQSQNTDVYTLPVESIAMFGTDMFPVSFFALCDPRPAWKMSAFYFPLH
jgi:hypothetical protein